jgi:DNA-binding NtrC family response regulator
MRVHLCLIHQGHAADSQAAGLLRSALRDCECSEAYWRDCQGRGLNRLDAGLLIAATAGPQESAIEFLTWFRGLHTRASRLALLHHDCGDAVIEMAAHAADDFAVAPWGKAELRQRLSRLTPESEDLDAVARHLIRDLSVPNLVGRSPAFQRVLERLPRVAASDLPILITGETGTGKDLCARVLHQLSGRRGNAFITADCSSIPGHLFENEMFGHVKGAYTDASTDQRGLVGLADGGTIFLDEIDTLAPETQAKLLRFVEEGMYRPLGGEKFRTADVRVIAATNVEMSEAVGRNRFRQDLYFRLNVLGIHLPPLRERPGDIPLLAEKFLRDLPSSGETGRKRFSQAAMQSLEGHSWPGNLRELRNAVQRAAVLAESAWITPEDLGRSGCLSVLAAPIDRVSFREKRQHAVEVFERAVVEEALRKFEGNVTNAAKSLRKDRRVLGRMLKRYGIDREGFASRDSPLPEPGPESPIADAPKTQRKWRAAGTF